jgi:hypothetical protein
MYHPQPALACGNRTGLPNARAERHRTGTVALKTQNSVVTFALDTFSFGESTFPVIVSISLETGDLGFYFMN